MAQCEAQTKLLNEVNQKMNLLIEQIGLGKRQRLGRSSEKMDFDNDQLHWIIYSLAETAKANHLKPYNYFEYLLEVISQHMDDKNLDFLEALLPWSDQIPRLAINNNIC